MHPLAIKHIEYFEVGVSKKPEQLHLSLKDLGIFIQALLNPPTPSKNLSASIKKYKKNIISK